MILNKLINKKKLIVVLSFLLITLLLFVQFWIKGTPVIRVDEGFNILISEKISENGQIPNYLTEYNGGQVQNYYPLYSIIFYSLYSIGGNIENSLYLFNVFLLVILFISFASFFNLTKKFTTSLLFLFSPIIVYQIFYVHSNYYPSLLCLFISIVSLKYLFDYLKSNKKIYLFISLFLYSILPMIHFFTFIFFTFIIFFSIFFYNRDQTLFKKLFTSAIYIIAALIISGYYIFLTLFYKITLAEPTSFVPKISPYLFNLIFPGATLIMIILGSLILLKRKEFYLFVPFILFFGWFLSSYTNFYLFASYRIAFILVLFSPIIITHFLKHFNNKLLRLFLFGYLIFFGIFAYSQVQNNFSIDEFNEIKYYFEENNIQNVTVLSYYRLNTWLPVLINNSNVVLANTDLYNTNYKVRVKVEKLFTNIGIREKWEISKELKIDYIILIKEQGFQDGSVYKGIGDKFNDPTENFFKKTETDRLYIYT